MNEFRERSDCCHVHKSGRNHSSVAGYVVGEAVQYAVRIWGLENALPVSRTTGNRSISCISSLFAGIAQSGSNPGGWRDFPNPSRPPLGPPHPPIQWVPGLSRGKRGAGA
jgi:hypothetical protein